MAKRRVSAALVSLICLLPLQFSLAQPTMKECGSADSEVTCSFFFNKLNAAFEEDNTMYTLRKFFFRNEIIPVSFDVVLTLIVKEIPDILCRDLDIPVTYFEQDDMLNIERCQNASTNGQIQLCSSYQNTWRHQWSRNIIGFITGREHLEILQDTNIAAFSIAEFNSFDTSVFSKEETEKQMSNNSQISSGSKFISFFLEIDFLPCMPDEEVLLTAWEEILPWISVYAMFADVEDVRFARGTRGFAFRKAENRKPGLVLQILTVIHVLMNILFALAATYLLSEYHGEIHKVKGKKYQVTASLYWALVLMCLIGDVAMIAGNCYLYYALEFDSSSPILFFRFTNDSVVVVLVIIELFASFFSPHNPDFFIPYLIRRALCCNLCCHCCGSKVGSRRLRFTILSIAMWIIIVFLQLLLSSLLPVAVVTVGNPVPSLALISVLCALFFCMVVFLAYFINAFEGYHIANHRLEKQQRSKSVMTFEALRRDPALIGGWAQSKLVLIAQAFVFFVIFAIMALIVIIFLNFVKTGAETNSVGGLFFSLVPSVALAGFTWAAKKHLFKEFEEEEEDKNDDGDAQQQQTLIKLGGITLRSSLRRKVQCKKSVKKRERSSVAIPLTTEATNADLSAKAENSGSSVKTEDAKEDEDTVKSDQLVVENTSAGDEVTSTSLVKPGDIAVDID